jgi:hypothetical protein
MRPRSIFIAGDGGFTSVGVVVALLVALTLMFTATQVHWVQSTAADIQFVADAGALAGENVVAEYLLVARTADAVVLSLSLFGLLVCGIAIVVSCIPYCQEVGAKLMDFGKEVLKARDNFASSAARALNNLQKALPFLVAVNAATTISGNQIARDGNQRYIGLALPLPLEGIDIAYDADEATRQTADEIGEQNAQTGKLTDAAQQAYEKMRSNKLEGYMADCGSNPSRCLYERAEHLASLSGAQNPYFSSVDLWSFDNAMARAKAYYNARLAAEKPASNALAEQVRSFVRKRFYTYAVTQMQAGYAYTAADGTLDAYFPLLASKPAEIRKTSLYTEKVYPVSSDGVLHGSAACPEYQEAGAAGLGSVAQLETGVYDKCATCDFGIAMLGNVASPTTSTDSGFEFHYRKVAAAADRYRAASLEYQEQSEEAKDSADEAFDSFEQALAALDTPRLTARPPGRSGCIAVVIDLSTHAVPQPFANSLVESEEGLPPRLALSAAAIANDEAGGGDTFLGAFLDKASEDATGSLAGLGLGVFDKVMEVWGWALLSYSEGVDALASGLGDFLNSIPLVRSTPLAAWAEDTLRETIEVLGLQGAELGTPKPVLVNTLHVARASQTAVGDGLVQAKEAYTALPGSGSGSLLSSALDGLFGLAGQRSAELSGGEITVFTISFGDAWGMPQIPISIALPEHMAERGQSLLSDMRGSVQNNLRFGDGYDVWE